MPELACATVAAALTAAAELAEARGGRSPAVALDAAHVAAAFRSERHARVDGRGFGSGFDPLSRFMEAADGCVRLHGNYPHHRAALHAALGDDVPAAVARRPAVEVEDAVVAAGGCAAAVRDEAAWRAHPAGAARTLLDFALGPPADRPLPSAGALPADGIRVLDLTRVIAGPVGTRFLAALGADVLRIDPPRLPEMEAQAIDTGPGKRSALLDVRAEPAIFEALLAQADVLVHGYRPGALPLDALAERHPHLTTVQLSAWGTTGPWGARRGFDSLVQAAIGIALACGDPGVLPAQALDHGTGYLIAAAALRGLSHRARDARPGHASLALARTGRWLLDMPRGGGEPTGEDVAPYLTAFGATTLVAPPGALDGRPLGWRHGPHPIGADPPRWR